MCLRCGGMCGYALQCGGAILGTQGGDDTGKPRRGIY